VPRLRRVELYLHSPIRIHGPVLALLSIGIALCTFTVRIEWAVL
jgi:hypothetical protein